jgi:hypothetical protein
MVTILITRPQYELTTHYLFSWSKKIIEFAQSRGDKILDLKGKRVTRENFEVMLRKMSPQLVLLNGHGNDNVVCGQDDEEILIANDNEVLLGEKIIYALACRTSNILGKKSVDNGATCYIGYQEDFLFWTHPNYATKPLDDPRAKMFLEPSNLLSTSLVKGHAAYEAVAKTKKAMLENIQKLIATDSPDQFMIPDILWDIGNLVCLGDQNAKLKSNQEF